MIELINFTDLTLEEKKMILSWRNNDKVKQWMYNTDDISIENHLNFIESLKNTTNKLYFLVKENDIYLGVIDFTNISEKNCDFGLYANIDLKGVGVKLLDTICDYTFNTLNIKYLNGEVFKENIKAISLYRKFKFKFKEINKKIINNKEVLYMELKNEDR